MGTPDFMSPEQLRGQTVSAASDIYAFGLILYQMVTGQKAFVGGDAIENAVQKLNQQPPPPSRLMPDLDPCWERAILGCLEREPGRRIGSAAEVIRVIEGSAAHILPAPPARRPRWLVPAVIFGILVSVAVGLRLSGWRADRSAGGAGGPQHVTVLPFQAPADDPGLQIFADGLMDSITSRLSQYESGNARLTVVPASEVRQQRVNAAAAARKAFSATQAVAGSILSQGDRVRLILTVIDTAKAVQTGSVTVENSRAKAFDLQDEAVTKLATALSLRTLASNGLGDASLRALSPGAYDYYLQALGYLQRRDKLENIDHALSLLDRAISADPDYAAAWATRGHAYWTKYDKTKEPKWIKLAVESCDRAVKANPDLAETHVALGQIRMGTGNYEQARQEYLRVIQLDPRSIEAHQGLAQAYFSLNRYPEAEETHKKAIALRPADWTGYRDLGRFYYQRGDYAAAIRQYEEVLRLTPDNALGYVNLGVIHVRTGDTAAAAKSWERALELDPNRLSTLGNLGRLAYQQGNNARAIELLERAVKINASSFILWSNIARAYRRAGNSAMAVASANKAAALAEEAAKVNPNSADLLSRIAFYRALAGQSAGVETLMLRAVRLAPNDADILALAAETYSALGNRPSAEKMLREAVAKGLSKVSIAQEPALRELSVGMNLAP